MFNRRRPSKGAHMPKKPPQLQSQAAHTAATHAFLNKSNQSDTVLSSAAAAAALRSYPSSPTEIEAVQTKRMVKRASAGSMRSTSSEKLQKTDRPMVHRGTSLSERTFRSPSPKRSASVTAPEQIPPVPSANHLLSSLRQRSASLTRSNKSHGMGMARGSSLDGGPRQFPPTKVNVEGVQELLRRNNSARAAAVNFSRPISPQNTPERSGSRTRKGGWFSGGHVEIPREPQYAQHQMGSGPQGPVELPATSMQQSPSARPQPGMQYQPQYYAPMKQQTGMQTQQQNYPPAMPYRGTPSQQYQAPIISHPGTPGQRYQAPVSHPGMSGPQYQAPVSSHPGMPGQQYYTPIRPQTGVQAQQQSQTFAPRPQTAVAAPTSTSFQQTSSMRAQSQSPAGLTGSKWSNPPIQSAERPRTATIVSSTTRRLGSPVIIPLNMLPTRNPESSVLPEVVPTASNYTEQKTMAADKPIVHAIPSRLEPTPATVLQESTNKSSPKVSKFTEHVSDPQTIVRESPNRTTSPAKSALKPSVVQPPVIVAQNEAKNSLDAKRKKSVRINIDLKPGDDMAGVKSSRYAPPTPISRASFDNQIDEYARPRPDLPSFGSIRSEREQSPASMFRDTMQGDYEGYQSSKSVLAGKGARREDLEAMKFTDKGSSPKTRSPIASPNFQTQDGPLKTQIKQTRLNSFNEPTNEEEMPRSVPEQPEQRRVTFAQEDSDSDDSSIYSDAEEQLPFTSLDAILEEPSPLDIKSDEKGKARSGYIDSTNLLNQRLEEARLNSKRMEEPQNQTTRSPPRSPKLMTSKWSPANVTESAEPVQPEVTPLVRRDSDDSVSSFRRSRTSTRPPTSKITLRSSLRGNPHERSRTLSPPAARPSARVHSPSGSTGSFSGHHFRSTLRGTPSDSSKEQKWRPSPSRIPSFLRPKHRRSSSMTNKSVSRFENDSDEDLPRNRFVSRFRNDSDDDIMISPVGNGQMLDVPHNVHTASSTSLEGENSSRDEQNMNHSIPAVGGGDRVYGGLASSKYASDQPSPHHRRWHSIFTLGHGRRSESFSSQLSRTFSLQGSQNESRPASSHAGSVLNAATLRVPSKLKKKPKRPGTGSRTVSLDGATALAQGGEKRVDIGKRRSTADDLLSTKVLEMLKADEEKAAINHTMGEEQIVKPADQIHEMEVPTHSPEFVKDAIAKEDEQDQFLTPQNMGTPELNTPQEPISAVQSKDFTPESKKRRFGKLRNMMSIRHKK